MRYIRLGITLALLFALAFVLGCRDVSRNDFEVSEDTAYINKDMGQFSSYSSLAKEIAEHLVASMRVLENDPGLKEAEEALFTYTGEFADRYGNKTNDIWTRVIVPVREWFKYSEEIRGDAEEVKTRMLFNWTADGFPMSADLLKELKGKDDTETAPVNP